MGNHEPDRERIMSDTTASATDSTAADATTTETKAADQAAADQTVETAKVEKDWQAEAEKWKTFARKHEDAAKANAEKAKRFDEFEESQKTEQQKLADKLAAAEERAAKLEAAKLVAEVAADKGVPANLLTGSTLEELTASADALIAFRGEKPKPDFGGGDRGGDVAGKGKQITSKADLNSMTPEEINQARREGRLESILRT